jgi:MoaA/NifB/PqqE/SkfB family radical SAM enzyme
MSTMLAALKRGAENALHALRVIDLLRRTPFGFVDQRHFVALADPAAARTLFKHSIDMVEIETFSYCNRRCWFCPNSRYDRSAANLYMEEGLYLGVIERLGAIGYDRKISFSRYNEPLADHIILLRLEQARQACPNACLHINTNGDFLDREYLDALYAHGLRSLNIQVYPGHRQPYDHERVRRLMRNKIESLKLKSRIHIDRRDERLEAALAYKDMRVRIYGRNFDRYGSHRGETVQVHNQPLRTSPCLSPFYHLYIDYDGSVPPCCNLRSDIPEHADAILGRLGGTSDIFTVYASPKAAMWRRALVGFEPKQGLCRRCSFVLFRPTFFNRRVQAELCGLARAAERNCARRP